MTGTLHDTDPLLRRLQAARARLVLERPFLGTLVLKMPIVEGDAAWCQTTATNGETLYYNADYIDCLSADELQFVVAHEALHCALGHFARRAHRVRHRWDLACDYAINPLLVDDGLRPPPGILLLEAYAGMAAEEIYPLLADNDHASTLDQHLYDRSDDPREGGQSRRDDPLDHSGSNRGDNNRNRNRNRNRNDDTGKGRGHAREAKDSSSSTTDYKPGTDHESRQHDAQMHRPPPILGADRQSALARQWQQRLASAAHHARQAGRLSAVQQRFIEINLPGGLSWRQLLARYLSARARDDYSYLRPSHRRGDPAILPTLRSAGIELAVAIDVSGSVSDSDIGDCLGEIDALKGQVNASTTLIACDADIVAPTPIRIETWEPLAWPGQIAGGGTTDFRPVFDYLERQDRPPDVLVFFTDALGVFPDEAPDWPVLWLVKGKAGVPWGTRLALDA